MDCSWKLEINIIGFTDSVLVTVILFISYTNVLKLGAFLELFHIQNVS